MRERSATTSAIREAWTRAPRTDRGAVLSHVPARPPRTDVVAHQGHVLDDDRIEPHHEPARQASTASTSVGA
jgi:hypothetical protein